MSEPLPVTAPSVGGARAPRTALLAGLVAAIAAAAQLPAVSGEFFSDDTGYIVDNSLLASIPLTEPWRFFTQWTNPWEYLPVRDLSYRVDLALFGPSPLGFHLVNVLLYALACAACFVAARSTLRLLRGIGGDRVEATVLVAATALFALHPAHVESVAWIASRKDLLSGLFALLALSRFALAITPERPSWRGILEAAALFALGLLSKASVLPLAPLLGLLALARFAGRAPPRVAVVRAIGVAAPFFALAAGSVALAAGFKAASAGPYDLDIFGYRPMDAGSLALRILGAFADVALAPVPLRLHYDVRMPGLAGGLLLLAGILTAGAGVWGAWALVRRRSVAGFGVAAFVLFTVPFLQLIPFSAWSEMCERWLFMPSFGLAMLFGLLVARASERWGRPPVFVAGAAVVGLGLVLTVLRSWEWGSTDRLVRANLPRAEGHPGAVSAALGVWAPALRYDDARRAAAQIRNAPLQQRVLIIADGWQSLAEGRLSDARRAVTALSTMTFFSLTAGVEGDLARRAGDDFEALRLFWAIKRPGPLQLVRERYLPRVEALQRELQARPDDAGLLAKLGNLQSELRLHDDAVATYRRTLRIAPARHDVHYNLAIVLRREEDFAGAVEEYRLAAGGLPQAWNDVGLCERRLGRPAAAEEAFRNAIAADASAWFPAFNLATSYLEWGRPADAREALAIARARALGAGAPVGQIDELMRRVEAGAW